MGAWIETRLGLSPRRECQSRPSWARGLKQSHTHHYGIPIGESRPSWARGLKRKKWMLITVLGMSRPSWARGLKLFTTHNKAKRRSVAPLVGAWIETANKQAYWTPEESRPSWARGLKPLAL